MAKDARKEGKAARGRRRGAAEAPPDDVPRLSAHPRARRHIALAKAWGGLGLFALVLLLSLRAGSPLFDALARGLAAGALGYLAAWALAVALWRHVAQAELEVARQKAEERRRELAEEAEQRRRDAAAVPA